MQVQVVDATPELLLSPRLAFMGRLTPDQATDFVNAHAVDAVLKCILVDGVVVGLCRIDVGGSDVSIAVHDDYRGRGVATEALRLTISEAFRRFPWPKVLAKTMERGDALGHGLARSLARFGIREVQRRTGLSGGKPVREILWELRREDFRP